MFEVITSFNQYYYDKIGRDCVNSWLNYWPEDMQLTCYVEDMSLETNPRIKQIGFEQLGDVYTAVQNNETLNSRTKVFAKKGFSVLHAMEHSNADWIIWIDADVITQTNVPADFWNNLLRRRYLTMYMGVTYTTDKSGNVGNWLVPETGIFAINRRHAGFSVFYNEYYRRYRDLDFSNLRKSYDNDVFGAAVLLADEFKHLDLCANFVKGYKTPMRHTVLGPYFHHHKAKHSKDAYQVAEDQ